jgi:hypothetical protein
LIISEAKLTPKLCSDSILTKSLIKTEKRVGYWTHSFFWPKFLVKPVRFKILDISKAFDRVWREGLFDLLWKNGIQGKCWKLLRSLYSNVSNKVLFGDFESDWQKARNILSFFDFLSAHIPCRVKMLSSVHCPVWKPTESHLKYHSFHITHSDGENILLNSLLDLFTKITDLEKIPEDWHKGIIKPIHKRGSMYDLNNYRIKWDFSALLMSPVSTNNSVIFGIKNLRRRVHIVMPLDNIPKTFHENNIFQCEVEDFV